MNNDKIICYIAWLENLRKNMSVLNEQRLNNTLYKICKYKMNNN